MTLRRWATGTAVTMLAMTGGVAQATDKPAASKASGPDRIVCRSMTPTGSRFAKQDCRTVAEWERMTEDSRKTASELINRPAISIERGN